MKSIEVLQYFNVLVHFERVSQKVIITLLKTLHRQPKFVLPKKAIFKLSEYFHKGSVFCAELLRTLADIQIVQLRFPYLMYKVRLINSCLDTPTSIHMSCSKIMITKFFV